MIFSDFEKLTFKKLRLIFKKYQMYEGSPAIKVQVAVIQTALVQVCRHVVSKYGSLLYVLI